jgi:hypothetical protein
MRSPGLQTICERNSYASMLVHPLKSEQKLGEHARLLEAREGTAPWRQWGPYLIERQWGTLSVEQRSRSGIGTKRNHLGVQGISGAEGRPAVPSAWRRQPPLTQSCPPLSSV